MGPQTPDRAEGTPQDAVEGLLRLLRRLDPAGRQRILEEGAQPLLCQAVARFCREQAVLERDQPRKVFVRHFGRGRVGVKSAKELSGLDQQVLRLLPEA